MPAVRKIALEPIGFVRSEVSNEEAKHRRHISKLVLHEKLAEALEGIQDFSHLFVLFLMHEITNKEKQTMKVHPRGRADMPLVGIFATRTSFRPNPIGLTLVELLKVEGNILTVRGLDAYDGTPVLDIKPFDPRDTKEDVRVPEWWLRLKRKAI